MGNDMGTLGTSPRGGGTPYGGDLAERMVMGTCWSDMGTAWEGSRTPEYTDKDTGTGMGIWGHLEHGVDMAGYFAGEIQRRGGHSGRD